tara:strand:- start:122 stop:808 length:687 start_codon:yes stop_codon:yes gene_type:complete
MSTPKMRHVVGRILRENFNLDNVESLEEFELVKNYIVQLESENTAPTPAPETINKPLGAPVAVTVNEHLVNNALVQIFDSLNGDDDDTRFEIEIVEQYIKQQTDQINHMQEKLNDAPEIAMYLSYFTEEILKQLPECTGDLFGIDEDCFVIELYPFAESIFKHTYEAKAEGSDFTGVFGYDAMEELAGLWISTVMRQQPIATTTTTYEMPELDEFELDIVRVVDSYKQ